MITIDRHDPYAFQIIPSDMTADEFLQFGMDNRRELRLQHDKDGDIHVRTLLTLDDGEREAELLTEVNLWRRKNTGASPSSRTGFTMPTGAVRTCTTSWINPERIAKMPDSERERFAAIVPDFVVEVFTKSDRLHMLKEKMLEWMSNGVRLAWLFDPNTETTYIYRENGDIETLKGFDHVLTGEDVMEGFEFDLKLLKNT